MNKRKGSFVDCFVEMPLHKKSCLTSKLTSVKIICTILCYNI